MFNCDACNGRNVNQNILGVKWQERMTKRMIVAYIYDKKDRRLGSQKLDQLPTTPENTDVRVI